MVMQANMGMAVPPDMVEGIDSRGTVGGLPNRGGGYGYGQTQNVGSASLPTVSDPEQVYADMTRQDYLDYRRDYEDFENQLIEQSQNDTRLIDQAREDVQVAQGRASGIASRNAQRYGAALTPAQRQQQGLRLQRANTLGGIQSVNDARIAQREANTQLKSDLINIGQGLNRSSLDQLGSAAATAANRESAYQSARAQSRAQTYSTLGSLGAAAIFAMAF